MSLPALSWFNVRACHTWGNDEGLELMETGRMATVVGGPRRRWWLMGTLFVLVPGLVALFWAWWAGDDEQSARFRAVRRGDLTLQCVFSAPLRAADSYDLYCKVAARVGDDGQRQLAELLWIIPNGTQVHAGDLVAEFSATHIRDELDRWQLQAIKSAGELKQSTLRYESLASDRTAELVNATEKLTLIVQAGDKLAEPQRAECEALLQVLARAQAGGDADALEGAGAGVRQRLGLSKELTLSQARLRDQIAGLSFPQAVDYLAGVAQVTRADEREELAVAAEYAYAVLAQSQRAHARAMDRLLADKSSAALALQREQERSQYFQQQLAACQVTAPCAGLAEHVAGTAEDQQLVPGQRVRERQKILVLHDLAQLQLTATLYGVPAQYLEVGQAATLDFRLGSGNAYTGTVTKVRQEATHTDVTVVPDPGCKLGPGAEADVTVITARRSDVLLVPVSALVTGVQEPYCYVRRGESLQQQPLRLGIVSDEYAEVLEGLAEGDLVVLDAAGLEAEMATP